MESTRTPPPPPPRPPSPAECTKLNPSLPKRHRGDMVDSPSKIAKPSDDDTVESTTEFAKPVYLVAALWAKQQPESYSVFMVDAAAVAGGNDDPPIARALGDLPAAEHGMSFVTAHSEHGTWIVGVGGPGGSTTIYDPRSTPAAGPLRGPELSYPKDEPILISHGGKVYALSRRPKVHRGNLDFPPWFESLSFEKGVACIYHDGCPSWRHLPPPPCFPCLLDPWEFRYPPDISVSSHAAFGSHILLSLQQEETGTYAFHVVEKTWEKVCDKNLPFVGQAVPIGGSLFAACRAMPNNAPVTTSVFHMSIEVSTPAVPGKLATSSIQVFPVPTDGEIPRPLLCPLGRGRFCSIRLGSCRQSRKARYLKDLQIILTAFQIYNVDAILTACQTKNAEAKDLHGAVLQVKQENLIYKLKGRFRFLASLHMPVIAALSM